MDQWLYYVAIIVRLSAYYVAFRVGGWYWRKACIATRKELWKAACTIAGLKDKLHHAVTSSGGKDWDKIHRLEDELEEAKRTRHVTVSFAKEKP